MATTEIANAVLGIDLLSESTALPEGAMRDVVNMDIHAKGNTSTRAGSALVGMMPGAHSLWSPKSRAFGLFFQGGALYRLTDKAGTLTTTLLMDGLRPSLQGKYYEYAGEVFFTNGTDLGRVQVDGTAKLLGLPTPQAEPTLAAVTGGMTPGRYGVAFSYIDALGQESGLSPMAFFDAPTGGLMVSFPPAPAGVDRVRVYATTANGDMAYSAGEVPAGFTTMVLASAERGKAPTTAQMQRMTGGSDVSVFNGVAFVSQGSVLRYSEPFYYGITAPLGNFITFNAPILFHEPVTDGLYVGTTGGTYFLSGGAPAAFTQRLVGPAPVMSDSITIPGSMLDPELGAQAQSDVVVWLSSDGFALGFDGGVVRAVQASRIHLNQHGDGAMFARTHNGIKQVISLVETALIGDGSAQDPIF